MLVRSEGVIDQSFVGEEDLEIDVLLYGEPMKVMEDGSNVFS